MNNKNFQTFFDFCFSKIKNERVQNPRRRNWKIKI